MTTADHVVFIVDDDGRIREALGELLEAHGIRAIAFGSAGEYVNAEKPDVPACLILDIELPDINGRSPRVITRQSFSSPDTVIFRPRYGRSGMARSISSPSHSAMRTSWPRSTRRFPKIEKRAWNALN